MQDTRLRVRFDDEAPRIGSGWRIVHAKVGRKIVHVSDEHGNRARFLKKAWDKIVGCAIALPAKRKRRRR